MDLTKQFLKFLKKANVFFQKGQYLECLEACSLANGILQEIQEDSSIPIKKLSFLQKMQPPLATVPSIFGQVKPANAMGTFLTLSPKRRLQ